MFEWNRWSDKSRLSKHGSVHKIVLSEIWHMLVRYPSPTNRFQHTWQFLAQKLESEMPISRRLRNQQRLYGPTKANCGKSLKMSHVNETQQEQKQKPKPNLVRNQSHNPKSQIKKTNANKRTLRIRSTLFCARRTRRPDGKKARRGTASSSESPQATN